MTRHLHTALALDGVGWHPAAWRKDPEGARSLHEADYWLDLALQAERGQLDLLTIDDTLALQTETVGAGVPRTDRVRGRVDAVLLARGRSQVRGCAAITNMIIDQLRHGGSYVAAPNLVLQSGPLALIISEAATSVARRNLDGWHYVISRLDLSSVGA